jgi:WD40 repeat protein
MAYREEWRRKAIRVFPCRTPLWEPAHFEPTDDILRAPEARLELVHAHSYSTRGGVLPLASGEVVFSCGSVCVVMGADGKQRFFQGHINEVTALAVNPEGNMVASAEAGDPTLVILWDPSHWSGSPRGEGGEDKQEEKEDGEIRCYEMTRLPSGCHARAVVCLDFSGDGKLMVSQSPLRVGRGEGCGLELRVHNLDALFDGCMCAYAPTCVVYVCF